MSKPITARWASIFTKKITQRFWKWQKAAGLATGNVSTAELQDATPAALVAHVTSRKCYGPSATSEKCPGNALEKGGRGSITEQLLNARADVTLGGGAKPLLKRQPPVNGREKRCVNRHRRVVISW